MRTPGPDHREAEVSRDTRRTRVGDADPSPELAPEIVSPTVRHRVRGHGTGVVLARADGREAQAARHEYGSRLGDLGSVAQLAGAVRAPAVRQAPAREGAGVACSGAPGRENEGDGERGPGARPGPG